MTINIFTSGFINKPERVSNRVFAKKLSKNLRRILNTSKKNVSSQELNSFLIMTGMIKNRGSFDDSMVEEIESGIIFNHFSNYYDNFIERRFHSRFKRDRELKETSGIVKNFLKFVDPTLVKELDLKIDKMGQELPSTFRKVSCKSLTTLTEVENDFYRFYLSGLEVPFQIPVSECEIPLDLLKLLDKFLILNFFLSFLPYSIEHLKEMSTVLNKLEEVWGDPLTHVRITDLKVQKKADLFFRILLAKLNALSELEQLYYRIFNLFMIPNIILSQLNLCSMDFLRLNDTLEKLAQEIEDGKELLHSVASSIEKCQSCLYDYLEKRIQTTDSHEEFKMSLKVLSQISVDLFVQSETLKAWADFFGRDIPHFSFDTLGSEVEEAIVIPEDIILSVRRIFKNYNLGTTTVYAVRGVSLDVKDGEFLAITGSSGAGKTTLLNCMAGLDTPDYGSVIFRGKKLSDMSDKDKSKARLNEMGFIFQQYALLPHYTTRENVALPAELANLDKELRERVEELLVGVGIDLQATQFPAQLSGGQLQRVAIARALTNDPTIIFADEPTGDLDSVTGKQVMELLKKFHETTGTTIVVITHDPDVAAYAQRELKMQDGVIK
ncbi:MAG: ABC transporter ATP-binding protein [Promethearchaeota archaeon]